ncbi:MAG: MFS transporter [Faecousia sp.]
MKLSKGYKKFLLLWSGEFVSAIGGGLSSFGLSVYVFQQTGSAASTALVTLLAFLPALVLGVPAGVLADRFDRRLMMMLGDGCSAIGLIYILICMCMGEAALWQICVGVTISSMFSALLDPAYKATVTDLLTKEEYTKASGLISLAGSSRYLIAPALAGALLAVADIRLLLIIDISTFFVTVTVTGIVRKGLQSNRTAEPHSFFADVREGWNIIKRQSAIITLIVMTFFMTFALGSVQILSEPMILSFASSTTLGIAETVCATGMLVSSLLVGVFGIKKHFVRTLCLSLFLAGTCMLLFGLKESILMICVFGFLFFAMLPFANGSFDYLLRTNIPPALQGRAWGLIGLFTQIGYVAAYGISGLLADGAADVLNISVGRGAAIVIIASGILMMLATTVLYFMKNVRKLENG